MRSAEEITVGAICTSAEDELPTDVEDDDQATESNTDDKPKDAKSAVNTSTRRWPRWIRPAMRWAAVGVVVAVLAGAGYEGWLLFQQHHKDVATTQALDAAKKYAVTLTSTDPNAIDQNFTDILNGATGDFKDTYSKASSRLRKMLIDNKVATQGNVIDSAVKSVVANKVVVLLFVKQSVTNSASPDPRTDLTAVTITMEKVNGRWLASKVVLPAEQG
jgi:Mce-associated membrane protein